MRSELIVKVHYVGFRFSCLNRMVRKRSYPRVRNDDLPVFAPGLTELNKKQEEGEAAYGDAVLSKDQRLGQSHVFFVGINSPQPSLTLNLPQNQLYLQRVQTSHIHSASESGSECIGDLRRFERDDSRRRNSRRGDAISGRSTSFGMVLAKDRK